MAFSAGEPQVRESVVDAYTTPDTKPYLVCSGTPNVVNIRLDQSRDRS